MMEGKMNYGIGKPALVTSVMIGPIYEGIAQYIEKHECIVTIVDEKHTRIDYPAGTTRQELYPRTIDLRYRILLPDGQELREIELRHGQNEEQYCLLVVVEDSNEADRLSQTTQVRRKRDGRGTEEATE